MKLLNITPNTKLADLGRQVGQRNLDTVLNANFLSRTPNVGKEYMDKTNGIINSSAEIDWQRKTTLLNSVVDDSDIYESLALTSNNGWKVFSALNTLPNMIQIPNTVSLPSSVNTLGNGQHIQTMIYDKAVRQLETDPHIIDPEIFNEYSSRRSSNVVQSSSSSDVFEAFRIPWGKVTLHSYLGNDSIDFPVYPEEIEDGVRANYETMPDLLYQYEPWQLYRSAGPRTGTYTFHMHRDMFTGDHRDGRCNELIRFCQASCYPEYKGAAVYSDISTLYIGGKPFISGIITEVRESWGGPIGLDDWYLECTLAVTFTEVSQQPLNFTTVRQKGLIG